MDQLISINNLLKDNHIRKAEYDGNLYFSIIDVFSVLLDTNQKQAQNYYHVFKKRLRETNLKLPLIRQFKAQASDQKFYLTEFTNIEGVEIFYSYTKININRKKFRIEERKCDEVINFHPKVVEHLQRQGWQTQHHVKLSSGHVIDIVAFSDNLKYIVECKLKLRNSLYTAIGQVLCYCQEYNPQAIPVIATPTDELDDYATMCCKTLGITAIGI